jgi:hypothetical protein
MANVGVLTYANKRASRLSVLAACHVPWPLHAVDQRLVHRLIAHAVRQRIDAKVGQMLGIFRDRRRAR